MRLETRLPAIASSSVRTSGRAPQHLRTPPPPSPSPKSLLSHDAPQHPTLHPMSLHRDVPTVGGADTKPHKSTSPSPRGCRWLLSPHGCADFSCGPSPGFTLTLRRMRWPWHCWEDPWPAAALATHFGGIEEEGSEKDVPRAVKISSKNAKKLKATPEPPLGAQEYASLPPELGTGSCPHPGSVVGPPRPRTRQESASGSSCPQIHFQAPACCILACRIHVKIQSFLGKTGPVPAVGDYLCPLKTSPHPERGCSLARSSPCDVPAAGGNSHTSFKLEISGNHHHSQPAPVSQPKLGFPGSTPGWRRSR